MMSVFCSNTLSNILYIITSLFFYDVTCSIDGKFVTQITCPICSTISLACLIMFAPV